MKIVNHGAQLTAAGGGATKANANTQAAEKTPSGAPQTSGREAAPFSDAFERIPGRSAFEQLRGNAGAAPLNLNSDLPELTNRHDGQGPSPKGGFDTQWVDRYKVLDTWRKEFDHTIITPQNADHQELQRSMIRNLETGLGLQPGQRAVVNGESGEYHIIGPPSSSSDIPPQFFNFREPGSHGDGHGLALRPGGGSTLVGGGGGGGVDSGGGVLQAGSGSDRGGGGFSIGGGRDAGFHPVQDGSFGGSPEHPTPTGPTGETTDTTPPDRPAGDDSSEGNSGGGNTDKADRNAPTTKDTMRVVDKLIASWSNDSDAKPDSNGEELPSGDPMTGAGGGGGDDIGARSRLPGRPRGITQQQADLVGHRVKTATGADDKERSVTGGKSGKSSNADLQNDIGGPNMRRPGVAGIEEVGPLARDIRIVSPIDPSKV